MKHWVDWCDGVGMKLADEGISVDDVIQQFIRPVSLDDRPELVPLSLEWPWDVFANTSEELLIGYQQQAWPFVDVGFEMRSHRTTGPIEFRVSTGDWSLDYELTIADGRMRFRATGDDAVVSFRNETPPLSEVLDEVGLQIFFEQDVVVVPPAVLLKPPRDLPPFDPSKLIPLDWSGINLSVESQGPERRPDSIQARTIVYIVSLADWDIVIDDDIQGEIADIVAMRIDGDMLHVHLTHCKFALDGKVGRRVDDLYEVCGQADKSTRWRRNISLLFQRLRKRQQQRVKRIGRDGFMKGDFQTLYTLEDQSRMLKTKFTIAISQPGLTKSRVSKPQLELLASTEVYVYETASAAFEVYCNP